MRRSISKYRFLLFSSLFILLGTSVTNAQTNQWRLIWDQNPEDDISHYRIFRGNSTNPTTPLEMINYPDTVFTDSDLTPDTRYYYRITAVDTEELESDYSDNVSAAIPGLTDILNQTFNQGQSVQIHLDNYVHDPDHSDAQISWTFSGNVHLNVSINADRIATISVINPAWYGSESITFTAMDPDSFFNQDEAIFTVNALPQVDEIADQTINSGESFAQFDLDTLVHDPDNSDAQLIWSYPANLELLVQIDAENIVTITVPNPNWKSSEAIIFTATDPHGATASNTAVFSINRAPQITGIPDQTTDINQPFDAINIDDFISDPDNVDGEIVWSFSGNQELQISDTNRVVYIHKPATDWTGEESVVFIAMDPHGLFDKDTVVFYTNAFPRISESESDTDIPSQLKQEGQPFDSFNLDGFVTDQNHADSLLSWTTSGQQDLGIEINEQHIVSVSIPDSNWFGKETVLFTVSDPDGASDSSTTHFEINAAPRIISQPSTIIEARTLFTYVLTVRDPDSTEAPQFEWAAHPQFLALETQTGIISGTPVVADTGLHNISIQVNDSRGGQAIQDFILDVQFHPNAPEFAVIEGQSIVEGETFTPISLNEFVINLEAQDSVFWQASGQKEVMVNIDEHGLAIISMPDSNWFGTEEITFRVDNPYNQFAQQTVTFHVEGVNDAPQILGILGQTIYQYDHFEPIELNTLVHDVDNEVESLTWRLSVTNSLEIDRSAENRISIVPKSEDWYGTEKVVFTVSDPFGLSDQKEAVFEIRKTIFGGFDFNFVGSGTAIELKWQTELNTRGQILFGTTTPDQLSEQETDRTKKHSIIVSGLASQTEYQFRALCMDSSGYEHISGIHTFTTELAGEINVFPIPYRAGEYPDNDMIQFANLPLGATLIIFNLLGEAVFKKEDLQDFFRWDVKNNQQKDIQSGLYIYLLKDDNNKKIESGKIVIIR